MEPKNISAVAVILALFMLGTRDFMPSHALSLNGSIEAFQHIAVGFLICLIIFSEGMAKVIAILALMLPTFFEIIMFVVNA